ncbi:DUF4384 domain-containing protein [Bauldia sp.]|uniref:DUF4384 domain-containing protein n=1 Tax=Bauldia sp. TaxID=2575872 RepID=UPI003BAB1101
MHAGRCLASLAALALGVIAASAVPSATVSAQAIPTPEDPVARAAFDVLDKHCARCHQDGLLADRLQPAKNFGHVLMLDRLASDPRYVAPGNPDGSRIVTQLLNREMPYDVYYEADLSHPLPNDADVTALRTWIAALGTKQDAACTDRAFIAPSDEIALMAADLEQIQRTRMADTRYLTLTHLHNACATDAEMAVYRHGAVKLLNSLSSVSDVVRLEAIDPDGAILRFNLKDLGWMPEDWDLILAVYPYAAVPVSKAFDLLATDTLTLLPYVRADWFAFTAAQPPLYNRLLKLPDDFADLQGALGVNVTANLQRFVAKRAGFQTSGVSHSNRLIERHTIPTGYFWTSYDFSGNGDRQNLFAFPLGPGDGPFDFAHDGGETIFSLPNGFQGYALHTAYGERLDKAPTDIVFDPGRRDRTVTNGISCMGCHDQGIRKATDEIRASVMVGDAFPEPVREVVEALYPTPDEMDALFEADASRFATAMRAAGLDPALKLNGVEMINALAKRYEDGVSRQLAAAELGMDLATFQAVLEAADDPEAMRLAGRLAQGLVPRDAFEAQFLALADLVSDLSPLGLGDLIATVDEPEATVFERPLEHRRDFDLALFSDRPAYRVGDLAVFTVATEEACYLTLINVDSAGTATVIFPNRFQEDNLILPGADLLFPADDAPFQFRLADPGTETVIAICSLEDRAVDAIAIDRDSVFTDLGDYDTHLSRAITVEAKAVPVGGKQMTPSDIVARTAITITVD